MTIMITGATGELGRATSRVLRRLGARDVVLGARRPESLEGDQAVRRVDYDEPSTMRAGFAGVSTLMLISSSADQHRRTAQHARAIEAAVAAGVRRVVYTSLVGADQSNGNPMLDVHAATERALRDSGLDWVILRNGIYMDFVPDFIGDIESRRVVAHPAGREPVAWITRNDIAEFSARVLLDAQLRRDVVNVVGSRALSLPNVVARVSVLSGRRLRYVEPTPEAYRSALHAAGVDAAVAEAFELISRAIRQGAAAVEGSEFERRVGRPAESVHTFLRRTYAGHDMADAFEPTLVQAPAAHAELLRDLAMESFADDFRRYGAKPPGVDSRAYHAGKISLGRYHEILVEGRVVGAIIVTPQGGDAAELELFFIVPAYQNRSIGAKALRLMEQRYAHVRQWRLVTPSADTRNHHFYEKQGYVRIATQQPDPADPFTVFRYEKCSA